MTFFTRYIILCQFYCFGIVLCYGNNGIRRYQKFNLLKSNCDKNADISTPKTKYILENVNEVKKSLLQAISYSRNQNSLLRGGEGSQKDKVTILKYVNELESLMASAPTDNRNLCSDGKWNLIYSLRVSSVPSSTVTEIPSVVDVLSGNLYKLFFKFAPLLAGGSASMQDITSGVVNEQHIDLSNNSALNIVKFKLPSLGKSKDDSEGVVRITVKGEAKPISGDELSVIFTSFTLNINHYDIGLPLPRPKGILKTTYCDSDLRISRGGRGGIFIVKRLATDIKDNSKLCGVASGL